MIFTGSMNEAEATAQQSAEIPDKLYFRIGEVSRLVGVPAYVLRYWETEFPRLAPKKTGTGHRLYRRKEVVLLLEIKQLLYDQRYTIEGARQHLETQRKQARRERTPTPERQGELFAVPPEAWGEVRKELASILEQLAEPRKRR
jgi:DNA-binding transcriptional MerR regulator